MVDRNNAEVGLVATLGDGENARFIVRSTNDVWRYVDNGRPVRGEDFDNNEFTAWTPDGESPDDAYRRGYDDGVADGHKEGAAATAKEAANMVLSLHTAGDDLAAAAAQVLSPDYPTFNKLRSRLAEWYKLRSGE